MQATFIGKENDATRRKGLITGNKYEIEIEHPTFDPMLCGFPMVLKVKTDKADDGHDDDGCIKIGYKSLNQFAYTWRMDESSITPPPWKFWNK